MIHLLDLMEPEETVGNLWHDMVTQTKEATGDAGRAADFATMRPSIAALFQALGGPAGTEIIAAPITISDHRPGQFRRIGTPREKLHVADFDGERLRLPPVMDIFPTHDLNRSAYLWLAALAAMVEMPGAADNPLASDRAEIAAISLAAARAHAACPGLRPAYAACCQHIRQTRRRTGLPHYEAAIERIIHEQLSGFALREDDLDALAPRRYRRYAPVPVWLRLPSRITGGGAAPDAAEPQQPALGMPTRKEGRREAREQADRRDSFIVHRFESIMSWAESLNINRMVDDDDQDNAAKAAEDQDYLTLSPNRKRAATRLRLSLDLSPQEADQDRLLGIFTYPEWNHRTGAHMPDHTNVLEAEGIAAEHFTPDARLVARVRRQFAPLHPRRVMLPRQLDGDELDLDALIASQSDLAAGREGSDRIWQASRPMARDLSVAILMDCSRSTEAAVGEDSVIDTARMALAALSAGIDTAGDRLAIWGFSSLRRDRVFLTRAKSFAEPMRPIVTARIGGFRAGHYTRLGAAIRHASAELAKEGATRKLLLVITDGKPNDLDHYEGVHGIEDSRMAVREARVLGQSVHGVIVDADGQDWFARIFGRAGFTLLPNPNRLPRALPDIYQTLTMEP